MEYGPLGGVGDIQTSILESQAIRRIGDAQRGRAEESLQISAASTRTMR
jgi:hypothetical protein